MKYDLVIPGIVQEHKMWGLSRVIEMKKTEFKSRGLWDELESYRSFRKDVV